MDPADIDKVISAELPEDPVDRALIKKFMMHSHRDGRIPEYCKKRSSSLPLCRFQYPKPITPVTHIDATSRVIYRRRTEEDQMVVPYNMELI